MFVLVLWCGCGVFSVPPVVVDVLFQVYHITGRSKKVSGVVRSDKQVRCTIHRGHNRSWGQISLACKKNLTYFLSSWIKTKMLVLKVIPTGWLSPLHSRRRQVIQCSGPSEGASGYTVAWLQAQHVSYLLGTCHQPLSRCSGIIKPVLSQCAHLCFEMWSM